LTSLQVQHIVNETTNPYEQGQDVSSAQEADKGLYTEVAE